MTTGTITAADIMQRDVVSLTDEMSLMDAFQCLHENRISGAPVVDQNGEVVGVLSQADLLQAAYRSDEFDDFPPNVFYVGIPFIESPGVHERAEALSTVSVEEAMNRNVISVSPSDSVDYLAVTMRSKHVHRVVVIEDKKLCGIVSTFDLLKLLENH